MGGGSMRAESAVQHGQGIGQVDLFGNVLDSVPDYMLCVPGEGESIGIRDQAVGVVLECDRAGLLGEAPEHTPWSLRTEAAYSRLSSSYSLTSFPKVLRILERRPRNSTLSWPWERKPKIS